MHPYPEGPCTALPFSGKQRLSQWWSLQRRNAELHVRRRMLQKVRSSFLLQNSSLKPSCCPLPSSGRGYHPGPASVRYMPVKAHMSTHTGIQQILNRPPKRQKQPTVPSSCSVVQVHRRCSTEQPLHSGPPALQGHAPSLPQARLLPAPYQTGLSSPTPGTASMGAGSWQSHTTTGTHLLNTEESSSKMILSAGAQRAGRGGGTLLATDKP